MVDWVRLSLPDEGQLVWTVDSFSTVRLGKYCDAEWHDEDEDVIYDIIAWAPVDYDAIRQDWNSS